MKKIYIWTLLAFTSFAIPLQSAPMVVSDQLQPSKIEDFLHFAKEKQGHLENAQMLEELYDKFLKPLAPASHPLLIAIGGSPGSGKTTFRNKFLVMENFHIHDMDEVMVLLPGYKRDVVADGAKQAFEKWWPTAREMAQLLVQYAIKSGFNIIYDRTCGAEGSYFDLLEAKKNGYFIRMIGLCVDMDVAKQRVLIREQKEGRFMAETILSEYRARFSALWPHYLKVVDEAILYETSDENLRLVFSSTEGVKDSHAYELFLEEGSSFRDFFSKLNQ